MGVTMLKIYILVQVLYNYYCLCTIVSIAAEYLSRTIVICPFLKK